MSLGSAFSPSDENQYDPTKRYQRTSATLEKSRIRVVYSAFDTETAVELAWTEYRGFPPHVLNVVEKQMPILMSIDHPNILKYHQAWVDKREKKIIFVTEAMPTIGKVHIMTVRRFLARRVQMKSTVIQSWLKQVLQGLHFLHSMDPPFIHRDLRCDNIYIRTNIGNLKIGGLELGLFMGASHPAEFPETPGYVPIELAGDTLPPKTDIYSFGMCVLEIFTFKSPYEECRTSFEIFAKQLSKEQPASVKLLKDPGALDLIEKCLSPIESRPSAAEILQHPFFSNLEGSTEENSLDQNDDTVTITQNADNGGSVVEINHPSGAHISVTLPEDRKTLATRNTNCKDFHSQSDNEEIASVSLTDDEDENTTPNFIYNSTIKCYTTNDTCFRYFYRDFSSVGHLKALIAEDIGTTSFQLEYVDEDRDNVLVTKRTSIPELQEHAKSLRCKLQ